MGDTEKADMASGRLAFATRRVDLMAASMRATLALCADGMTILPPTKRGKNLTRWWFEFKERLAFNVASTLSPLPPSHSTTQSTQPLSAPQGPNPPSFSADPTKHLLYLPLAFRMHLLLLSKLAHTHFTDVPAAWERVLALHALADGGAHQPTHGVF